MKEEGDPGDDFFRQIINWIYPSVCEICGDGPLDRSSLCSRCLESLERLPRPLCPRCGAPVQGSVARVESCEVCREGEFSFDFARSTLANCGKVRDLILAFKYAGKIYLRESFGKLMVSMQEEYADCLSGTSWILLPVPMNRKKLLNRGYNQAEELACVLSKQWGFPIKNALKRSTDSISQVGLDRGERMKHVKKLYEIKPTYVKKRILEGKNVLLIDDIFTTGSTAEACVRILKKQAKVSKVGVITLARTVPREQLPFIQQE